MQIVIEIPDRLIGLELGYMDIRLHKDKEHVNSVTTQDYEKPYFAELKYFVLPKGHGRLIDADDIALVDEQFYTPSDYYVAESAIEDTPTIIERDGEG